MTSPLVSFLLATNQAGEQFQRALNSCLSQSYDNFEIIVVANGMSDASYSLLEQHVNDPRIRLHRTDVRRLTFSLNYGLHLARGVYIARMDADDICYSDRLAEQVKFLEENLEISICGSWCDLINSEDRVIGEWHYAAKDREIRRQLYYKNPLCHPTVMYRREIVVQAGGYFDNFCEDYSLWAFLSLQQKVKFANIPKKLIGYRANYGGHPRNIAWRNAKSSVAGMQFQLFGATGNPFWLIGAIYNIFKAMSAVFHKNARRIEIF